MVSEEHCLSGTIGAVGAKCKVGADGLLLDKARVFQLFGLVKQKMTGRKVLSNLPENRNVVRVERGRK